MTINLNILTPDAVRCLDIAVAAARERHYPYVDTEHLLIGILNTDMGDNVLAASGVAADELLQAILNELSMVREEPLKQLNGLTRNATQALFRAQDIAQSLASQHLNSGHILLSLLREPDPFLADVLSQYPQLDLDQIQASVISQSAVPSSTFEKHWRPATWETAKYLVGKGTARTAAKVTPIRGNVRIAPAAAQRRSTTRAPGESWMPAWAALLLLAAVISGAIMRPDIAVPVVIVVGGWIISLVLHEFGHALVAYWGGDHTVVEKGYLSLNPMKYMHPLLSIGLPMLFLLMGGIGLPGGAVYIERHRLRSRYWGAAVSAAGPFANLICLLVFSAPFWTGYVDNAEYVARSDLWSAVAFLAWLQGTAILFNLIPFPPLDGFGIIEPFLPEDLAINLRSMGFAGLFLIILIFWLPRTDNGFHPADAFFDQVDSIADQVEVQIYQSRQGWDNFQFWEDN